MIIGFTVGVFDLLHAGHMNLLQSAAHHCDYLVVGVTTDWLARVQKGHDRPSQSYEARALAVAQHLEAKGIRGRVVAIDTFDMHAYLQLVDVWILGENQKNMRPFTWPNQVRIPETPGISTTMLLSQVVSSEHVQQPEGEGSRLVGAAGGGRDHLRREQTRD